MNNQVYVKEGGKQFFERNKNSEVSPFIEHLSSLLPKTTTYRWSICELGCSNGNNLAYLAERFSTVEGYEVVPDAVSDAKLKLDHLNCENASIHERNVISSPPSRQVQDICDGFFSLLLR
jgi:tRNA/tmRNA/rRNA uracil-C5-methylase (TrmA/RlmC/RlmD family)